MAINLIARVPIRKHGIGDGVEARNVELLNKQVPLFFVQRRELRPETAYHKGVERSEKEDEYANERHFLFLYFQHSQIFLHCRLYFHSSFYGIRIVFTFHRTVCNNPHRRRPAVPCHHDYRRRPRVYRCRGRDRVAADATLSLGRSSWLLGSVR